MKFIKNLICNAFVASGVVLLVWLIISWADVLLHNDPITGDAAYWRGNAIVMMINLTE